MLPVAVVVASCTGVSVFLHFSTCQTGDSAYKRCSQLCIFNDLGSGVAGPLAAQGGGQICRPFVLGF